MTSLNGEAKPGDLPERFAAFERPRKGVQAAVGILLSEKRSRRSACPFAAEEVTGFCFFRIIWSAPAERSGDGALDHWLELRSIQSGVALRLPPLSKFARSRSAY